MLEFILSLLAAPVMFVLGMLAWFVLLAPIAWLMVWWERS